MAGWVAVGTRVGLGVGRGVAEGMLVAVGSVCVGILADCTAAGAQQVNAHETHNNNEKKRRLINYATGLDWIKQVYYTSNAGFDSS